MIYQGEAKYPVKEVMLHCAAIPTGYFHKSTPFQVFSTINKWHHERGWKNGFGYHGLFMPDGHFYAGRPVSMIGAGCRGRNQGVIHLLMIERKKIEIPEGQTLETQVFSNWFSLAQAEALAAFIGSLDGIIKVSGHNEYAGKLCPGFVVKPGDFLPRRSSVDPLLFISRRNPSDAPKKAQVA